MLEQVLVCCCAARVVEGAGGAQRRLSTQRNPQQFPCEGAQGRWGRSGR